MPASSAGLNALRRHAGVERRLEMLVLDLVEGRQAIGQSALARERIVGRERGVRIVHGFSRSSGGRQHERGGEQW
jgi:hypothetical protein